MYLLRRIFTLCILPVALFATACGSDNNGPTAPTTPPPQGPAELQKIDVTVGTGDEVVNNKVVSVAYILWRYDPNGTDFKGEGLQQSTFQFRTGTNGSIPGFEQGILGMKVGGVRRLVIPPNLAYGAQGSAAGGIRPNEWLVFDVQVLGVS